MKIPAFLKTWWSAHLAVIAGIAAFLDPSIEHWASAHPGSTFAAVLLLIVGAIVSPASKAQVIAAQTAVTGTKAWTKAQVSASQDAAAQSSAPAAAPASTTTGKKT